MSKINLNPGDSIVTKNQNGMRGIPVDARTQVQYYKDIQNIEYAYENLQVIVTDDDPTDLQHPKGIYVVTKLDANNDVDLSGIKSLKETVNVTKQDIGLENVDNVKQVPQTRTINSKPLSSNVTLNANDVGAIPTTEKGANGGVAELDNNGKLKSTQIPTTVATTDGLNQKVDKISNAEGNLPKINSSGNLENSGFSIPTTENSDQILGYDNTIPGKLKWINKPVDGQNGDSAYQIWLDNNQHQSTDPGYNETDFLNSLKAHIGNFHYENTDADVVSHITDIGDAVSSINNLVPGDGNNGTDDTLDVIVLMNNGDTTTPKTMMFSTSGDSTNGYKFYYVGDLQSAMSINVLTDDRIVNDFTTGGATNVASAETVKEIYDEVLKEKANAVFSEDGYMSWDYGTVSGTAPTYVHTDYIPLDDVTAVSYKLKIGGTAACVAFYGSSKNYLSQISVKGSSDANGVIDITGNAYASAKYVVFSTEGSYANNNGEVIYGNTHAQKIKELVSDVADLQDGYAALEDSVSDLQDEVDGLIEGSINFQFSIQEYIAYDNGYNYPSGNTLRSDYIPLAGYTNLQYRTKISSAGAAVAFFSSPSDSGYLQSISITGDGNNLVEGNIDLTNAAYSNAVYVVISAYSYPDVSASLIDKNSIIAKVNDLEERVSELEEGGEVTNPFKDIKVLIFGDSITDCMALNVDGTTNTSTGKSFVLNGYYDENHNWKTFKMWPQLLSEYFDTDEVRCYAKSGATYKNQAGHTSGGDANDARLSLSYQILVAENDLTNPNNVFPTVGDYVPDIVIFALGTNDNTFGSGDSYATAMGKTVYIQESDVDVKVNIDSTLNALDLTRFHEAIRYAFLKTKHLFPQALFLCVLPIQRWNYPDLLMGDIHIYIKEMAETYSIPTIDGAYAMGIVRDLEANSRLGTLLKDGLHPNEKGQNVYARMIITEIKNRYISFDGMNS